MRIEPVRAEVAPGEAISVRATLTNTGPVDVVLDEGSLTSPVMSLRVTVAGREAAFTDLPLLSWRAPHSLEPGKSLSAEMRIDLGSLALYLASRPLETVALEVNGLLGPVQLGESFESSVPKVVVPPARIVRRGLIESFGLDPAGDWPKTYRLSLGYVVRDMKRGSLRQRLRAARQVGSLLTLVRNVELHTQRLKAGQVGAVTKPVLLTMLRVVLEDNSPAVRAEMVAALEHVTLDGSILPLLGPVIEHPSPLVRLRVAELMGASGIQANRTVLDYLAQDKDELVRAMAEAFRTKPPANEPE